MSLKTFIIYASADRAYRDELQRHLQPLVDNDYLELWSDREILPGEAWDAAIKQRLNDADVFLMLVSVDFYNSGYIREEEFRTAVARREAGAAIIIPIIVRDCNWNYFPVIKDLQVLPPEGRAVSDPEAWSSRDKAWRVVVEKIAERIERQRAEQRRAEELQVAAAAAKAEREAAEQRRIEELQAAADAERARKARAAAESPAAPKKPRAERKPADAPTQPTPTPPPVQTKQTVPAASPRSGIAWGSLGSLLLVIAFVVVKFWKPWETKKPTLTPIQRDTSGLVRQTPPIGVPSNTTTTTTKPNEPGPTRIAPNEAQQGTRTLSPEQLKKAREIAAAMRTVKVERIIGVNRNTFQVNSEYARRIVSFDLYDRWGKPLIQKTNLAPNSPLSLDKADDGRELPADEYPYAAKITWNDGLTTTVKGTVFIRR